MSRRLASGAALVCGLAAAAGGALAQQAAPWLRLDLASREAALGRRTDPVLQLKLRSADADLQGGQELGAALDVRQAMGSYGSVRELTLYGAVRAGEWRWQGSVTRGFLSPEFSVGMSVRRAF